MGKEDAGESSSRKDDSYDSEKPLKKARYVWEVKGKFHLKNKYKHQSSSSGPKQGTSRAATSANIDLEIEQNNNNDISTNNNNNNFENNNNNNNNNNEYTDRCCMETIAASSEKIMEFDDHEEQLQHLEDPTSNNQENQFSPTAPKEEEDYYLIRWHARQVAKGYVDNTINRFLEHWLAENCDGDGHVVDEAILMAIQSHGLRQDSGGSAGGRTDGATGVQQREIAKSAMDNYENAHNEMKNGEDDGVKCEDDPMEFLNAAVSVAISKKGLSSGSYD